MTWICDERGMKSGVIKRMKGVACRLFVLGLLGMFPLPAVTQTIPAEKWEAHPSAAKLKDPSVFRDIGDVAKSSTVFYDGRRSVALTEVADMAVVRPTVGAKALMLPAKKMIEVGPESLRGSYNHGWSHSAGAYLISQLSSSAKGLAADPQIEAIFPVYKVGATVWGLSDLISLRFLPNTPPFEIDRILHENHLEIVRGPEAIGLDGAYDLRLSGSTGDFALILSNSLAQNPAIDYSSPDWINLTVKHFVPNDPLYRNQWHLESASVRAAVADSDINVELAWDRTLGTGVTICVIDDGVDYDHEDLRIVEDSFGNQIGFDPVDRDNDPRPEFDDSHGTSVSGVIAAVGNNGVGVVGVAPDAKVFGVRFVGYPVTSGDIRDSFLFALSNNADLCNNSWGRAVFSDPCDDSDDIIPLPLDPIIRDGLEELIFSGRNGLGCVVTFAAGNDRVDISVDELNGHPEVISVAGSNNLAKRSWYSSYGTPIDVCAPTNDYNPLFGGANCLEIWTGGELGITTTATSGTGPRTNPDYTSEFGGTSSACPTVTGVAALVLSVEPQFTYNQVKQRLTSTSVKIDQEGGGYDDNGFSLFYGFGRVDAAAAVGLGPVVPTFTPTIIPTPTVSPTPSNTPTATNTPSPTRTPTPTFTPSNTPTPTPTFTPRVTHVQERVEVGVNPVSIVASNLDGANFDDILTANRGGDDLSVALNGGGGSFAGAISIPLDEGDQPSFVTSGDLNNDGAADILAIAAGSDRLIAFLQTDGKGLEEEGVPIGPKVYVRRDFPNLDVSDPIAAFIGDLNGDGFMDLAVANSSGDDLTVVFGSPNPEGLSLSVGERISCGGSMPVFVTGGVLRPGEPGLQLVTTNWRDSTVSVIALDREIEGDLVADVDVYPAGVNPRHAVIADFDLDGDNDVAVTCQGAPQLSFPSDGSIKFLFNISGTGQFVIPNDGGTLTPGGTLIASAAFDFDGNGFLDLAVSQRSRDGSEGHLLIYYNDPVFVDVPGFKNFDPFEGPGVLPLAVASAGLNGGPPPNENTAIRDDLLITDQASNTVGVVTITDGSVKGRTSADLNFDKAADSSDLFLFALLGGQRDAQIRKSGDLTGEGVLNAEDLLKFLQLRNAPVPPQPQYAGVYALPKGESLPDSGQGDANGDGTVDSADFYAAFY